MEIGSEGGKVPQPGFHADGDAASQALACPGRGAQEAPIEETAEENTPKETPQTKKYKILLIEDAEEIR